MRLSLWAFASEWSLSLSIPGMCAGGISLRLRSVFHFHLEYVLERASFAIEASSCRHFPFVARLVLSVRFLFKRGFADPYASVSVFVFRALPQNLTALWVAAASWLRVV